MSLKNIKKLTFSGFFSILLFYIFVSEAFAHVVVQPSTVNVGQRLNFFVGVPTEKDIPTTSVRLVIPEGLESVRPLVKPGWEVEIKRNEAELVTEIIWSGGRIPADMKDEFVISAKVPANEVELNWKAYQTYSDGSVVSWDLSPDVEERDGFGPYSVTKIINDLDEETSAIQMPQSPNNFATLLSIAAFGLASYACFFRK